MNTRYWNKATLYRYVDALRKGICDSSNFSPVDSEKLAMRCIKNLTIEKISFLNSDICGILYKGNYTTSIALNTKRSPEMQNFDCMHELIHYFFHDIEYCQRICSDKTGSTIRQDAYIEWQANEGAAQFLMPYQDFIPRFLPLIAQSFPCTSFQTVDDLAQFYRVTPAVIEVRINQLSYEIDQYRQGRSLEQIQLLSKKKREQQGIKVTPYLALLDFALDSFIESVV